MGEKKIKEELEAEGRLDEYDPDYIPTFREIVLACEKQNPPYPLWFREPEEEEILLQAENKESDS